MAGDTPNTSEEHAGSLEEHIQGLYLQDDDLGAPAATVVSPAREPAAVFGGLPRPPAAANRSENAASQHGPAAVASAAAVEAERASHANDASAASTIAKAPASTGRHAKRRSAVTLTQQMSAATERMRRLRPQKASSDDDARTVAGSLVGAESGADSTTSTSTPARSTAAGLGLRHVEPEHRPDLSSWLADTSRSSSSTGRDSRVTDDLTSSARRHRRQPSANQSVLNGLRSPHLSMSERGFRKAPSDANTTPRLATQPFSPVPVRPREAAAGGTPVLTHQSQAEQQLMDVMVAAKASGGADMLLVLFERVVMNTMSLYNFRGYDGDSAAIDTLAVSLADLIRQYAARSAPPTPSFDNVAASASRARTQVAAGPDMPAATPQAATHEVEKVLARLRAAQLQSSPQRPEHPPSRSGARRFDPRDSPSG